MTRRDHVAHWMVLSALLVSIAGLGLMALPASVLIQHPIERSAP